VVDHRDAGAAYLIKVALGDSFAMTAIIATYQRETVTLTPDPNMVARLDSVSDKFKNLTQRAANSIATVGVKIPSTTRLYRMHRSRVGFPSSGDLNSYARCR